MSVAEGETYGQTFRRLRLELGMTQPEAAEACGINLRTVAAWEADARQFNHRDQSQIIRRAIARLKRKLKYRQGRE